MCQESKLRKKNLSIENQPHVTMSHESANQNTNKKLRMNISVVHLQRSDSELAN